jgi:DinB superfamily
MTSKDFDAEREWDYAMMCGKRRENVPLSPIDVLLRLIDQGFDHKAWHGPNLRGALRGLEPEVAAWHPAKGRHCIWEIAVHCAYWKYIARRRLLGEKRGSFPLKGSNWFAHPCTVSKAAWQEDIALLELTHRTMREAVGGLSAADLHLAPPGSKVSNLDLIAGIAGHDVYHAGQIQVLKKLAAGGAK